MVPSLSPKVVVVVVLVMVVVAPRGLRGTHDGSRRGYFMYAVVWGSACMDPTFAKGADVQTNFKTIAS